MRTEGQGCRADQGADAGASTAHDATGPKRPQSRAGRVRCCSGDARCRPVELPHFGGAQAGRRGWSLSNYCPAATASRDRLDLPAGRGGAR